MLAYNAGEGQEECKHWISWVPVWVFAFPILDGLGASPFLKVLEMKRMGEWRGRIADGDGGLSTGEAWQTHRLLFDSQVGSVKWGRTDQYSHLQMRNLCPKGLRTCPLAHSL